MFLTSRHKDLLREIYMVPPNSSTVVIGGGQGMFYGEGLEADENIGNRLDTAIAAIEIDESKSRRVAEILAAYEEFALDWSPIDRDGYSFRPTRNLKRLYKALWTYTGIWVRESSSNTIPLG